MGTNHKVNKGFVGVDVNGTCRNWTPGKTGDVRMTNHVSAMQALERGVNHLLGQCPRVRFSKAFVLGTQSTGSSDVSPLLRWRYQDDVVNGRRVDYRVISLSPESAPTDAYWQRVDSALASDTGTKGVSNQAGAAGSTAKYMLLREDHAVHARGDVPGTPEHEEGIETFDGYQVISVVVQDQALDNLNTTDHDYIPAAPNAGDPILGDTFGERLRSKLHAVRTTNLPTWNWAAQKIGGNYLDDVTTPSLTANSGESEGIYVDVTTPTNILDFSSTSRSATSPGVQMHVQYCGLGKESVNNGKKVKIQCRVLAKAKTQNGTVEFHAPGVGGVGTSTTITVTSGAAVAWYGGSSNFVYLDASIANTSTASSRAKIDMLADVVSAGGKLFIYGIAMWMEYGL